MAYSGGKLADGTPLNVAVYRAYHNAGLSHNQALAITAEVGRENSFNPRTAFGTHPDPARDSQGRVIRNVGMLSWNQGRDTQVLNYLNRAGVLGQPTQANLNAQAAFSVQEMKGKYRNKLQYFLNNPNADPESFSRELGKNYVVWAYGQNTIRDSNGGRKAFDWQSHDNRRRSYLGTLNNMVGGSPLNNNYSTPQRDPRLDMDAPTLLAHLRKKGTKLDDTKLFVELANGNGWASQEIQQLLARGEDPANIAKSLGLTKVKIAPPPQAEAPPEPVDPKYTMDAPTALAQMRQTNSKISDDEAFNQLLNGEGKAAQEVNYLIAKGEDPAKVAQALGLKISQPQDTPAQANSQAAAPPETTTSQPNQITADGTLSAPSLAAPNTPANEGQAMTTQAIPPEPQAAEQAFNPVPIDQVKQSIDALKAQGMDDHHALYNLTQGDNAIATNLREAYRRGVPVHDVLGLDLNHEPLILHGVGQG